MLPFHPTLCSKSLIFPPFCSQALPRWRGVPGDTGDPPPTCFLNVPYPPQLSSPKFTHTLVDVAKDKQNRGILDLLGTPPPYNRGFNVPGQLGGTASQALLYRGKNSTFGVLWDENRLFGVRRAILRSFQRETWQFVVRKTGFGSFWRGSQSGVRKAFLGSIRYTS